MGGGESTCWAGPSIVRFGYLTLPSHGCQHTSLMRGRGLDLIYGQLRQMRLFPERKPRPERWHRRGSHMPSSPTVRGKERIGCQKLASDLHTHALAHIQTRTKHIKHHFKKKQKAAPLRSLLFRGSTCEDVSLIFFGYRPDDEDSGNKRLLFKGNCLGECQSDLTEVPARCAVLAGKPTADALVVGRAGPPPAQGRVWR